MSKGSHLKKDGHRKDKQMHAMRADEYRRHSESGEGHRSARLDPHTAHTRRQEGQIFVKIS